MSIDEERLKEVLNFDREKIASPEKFAWMGSCSSCTWGSLEVDQAGDFPIPISPQDFDKLVALAQPALSGMGKNLFQDPQSQPGCVLEVEGSQIQLKNTTSLPDILNHAVNQLLGSELHDCGIVKAQLEKMIILLPGGHYSKQCVLNESPGIFGTMMLCVPILPTPGQSPAVARLSVQRSDSLFHREMEFDVSAFYADCQHHLEGGPSVTLAYSLLWPDCFKASLHPIQLPTFLSAQNEVRRILSSWSNKSCSQIVQLDQSSSMDDDDLSDDEEKLQIIECDVLVEDYPKNMVLIQLEEEYAQLGFRKLRNVDKCRAHLLQSIDFVDVHLADVVSKRVIRWIDSDLSVPQCNSGPQVAHMEGDFLVIQPLDQSLKSAIDSGLIKELLQSMEERLPAESGSERVRLINTLDRLIDIGRMEPKKMLPLAERILDFCRNLRAEEQGLKLLDVLAATEGVRNAEVARAIVEFECDVTGWETSSAVIMKLITPTRMLKQLIHLTELALMLASKCCYTGAYLVANRLWCLLTVMDLGRLHRLTQAQIDAYFDLVMALERDPRTANSRRLSSLPDFVVRLKTYRQFQLVLDLKENDFSRLRDCPSGFQIYGQLCNALPKADINGGGDILVELILPALEWFIQLNNPALTDAICSLPCEPNEGLSRSYLLDLVLSSTSKMIQLAGLSDFGRSSVTQMIQARLKDDSSVPIPILKLVLWMNEPRLDAAICPILFHLPIVELAQLVLDASGFPMDRSRVIGLFQLLNLRSKESMRELSKELLMRLVAECFRFGDHEKKVYIRALMEQLTLDDWSQTEREVIFDTLSRNGICWDDLLTWSWSTVESLLRTWIERASRNPEKLSNCDLLHCIQLYIRHDDRCDAAEKCLAVLCALLTKLVPAQLTQLALEIHRSEWADSARTDPVYLWLCEFVAVRADLPSLTDHLEELFSLLYKSGDGQFVLMFARRICQALPANLAIRIISSETVKELALSSSPDGKKAFCLLLDRHVESLKTSRIPAGMKKKRLSISLAVRIREELEQTRSMKQLLMPQSVVVKSKKMEASGEVKSKFIRRVVLT